MTVPCFCTISYILYTSWRTRSYHTTTNSLYMIFLTAVSVLNYSLQKLWIFSSAVHLPHMEQPCARSQLGPMPTPWGILRGAPSHHKQRYSRAAFLSLPHLPSALKNTIQDKHLMKMNPRYNQSQRVLLK